MKADLNNRRLDAIARHIAGETFASIAARHGVNPVTIFYMVKKTGAHIERSPGQRDFMLRPIIEAYEKCGNLSAIARERGEPPENLHGRFYRLGSKPWMIARDLRELSAAAREEYFEAIDKGRLPHADALEIALEYCDEVAA